MIEKKLGKVNKKLRKKNGAKSIKVESKKNGAVPVGRKKNWAVPVGRKKKIGLSLSEGEKNWAVPVGEKRVAERLFPYYFQYL